MTFRSSAGLGHGIVALVLTMAFASVAARAQDGDDPIPAGGPVQKGWGRLDPVVRQLVRSYEIPGASLAVSRGDAILLARGYGWADRSARVPVKPETLFALASVSKSLTAVTVLKLVEAGKLDLDTPVFDILTNIKPLGGDKPDPRLGAITVRHLLYHAGGWDRTKSGDPNSFSPRVAERMRVPLPVTAWQLARYMLGQRLDFDPGSDCKYSNFGYVLLGLVIEERTRLEYEPAVRQILLRPLGMKHTRLNRVRGSGYLPNEAHRYGPAGREDIQGGHLPITMASGGWLSTPSEMVRFLAALEPAHASHFLPEPLYQSMLAPLPPPAPRRPDGSHFGMGWDRVITTPRGIRYHKGGGLLGVHTWIEHRADGLNWALFWNGGRVEDEGKGRAIPEIVRQVNEAIDEVASHPQKGPVPSGEPDARGH